MKLNQIWHCPRPHLADSYLALLSTGLVVSTSIFAPRRTGKTVFLRQDLTPAALAKGHVVAYADLWQTRQSPGVALIRGLEEALAPKTLTQKALHSLQRPVKSLKGSAKIGEMGLGLEVALEEPRGNATEMALRIEQLVEQLAAKKPLLLLVDEAQELARTKEAELIATALRTAMTKHRDRMRVVFTGSSRSQLAHVFSNTDAPLYTVGATVNDFPLLGREFVEFVATKFHQACGRRLDAGALWKEFQDFKQQPEPLLSSVVALLMDPNQTLQAVCERERAEQNKAENHEGTWAALDPLQRQLVLLASNNPQAKPFAKTTLTTLARKLGLTSLDAASVQYALRRLAEKNVVVKSPRGIFEFESDAFERWVKTLAE
ncbi:MAG TPA: AAA family ATPase [Ramlibacter sp.]|nr:AAA family ATPase [Ramlibacter sp.]